ncbi:MarR family transcriptional regulator [Streptobacillus moniliformis]|uniref:Transcriptional regulator, MarR family n=1 Tax=Streptobacillus moniliformis (strain ATCC 14647 / DSM 12112 / NCTC 10651 / 9901) TaxID=519441 RepID=D1AVA1_STRM9|nr:MarR family transcriptional regulator [Streptobacillus moniliformis]ACZ01661.1 transcriptional regulator, MarR family [Streptobacillus moniliformis DSM 12112]AVL43340.1 MarR family transcriptional regulator [Streptobacillus moniliformis]SQA13161.1 staphylococcal accessory regulator family [Streptobacillus moniliformis]
MYDKMENLIDEFYKTYYKMEEINLSLAIKCLTTTELHIIECIGLEKITIKELSTRLGITMGTTSIAINKLEEKKFINRVRSKADKRKVYVSLNKKGQIAYNYHGNFHATTLEKVTKNIPENRLDIFLETFEELLNNLKSLKLNLEPEDLTHFNIGDKVEVTELKGNNVIKLALSEMGIKLKTSIEILDIHKDYITIKINDNEKLISKDHALYIFALKKEN